MIENVFLYKTAYFYYSLNAIFLWDSGQTCKNKNAVVVIDFQCHGRMSYQSKRSQAELLICCSPAHGAPFGIFPFEKFHQEVIKFFFTKDRICHDFIHFDCVPHRRKQDRRKQDRRKLRSSKLPYKSMQPYHRLLAIFLFGDAIFGEVHTDLHFMPFWLTFSRFSLK